MAKVEKGLVWLQGGLEKSIRLRNLLFIRLSSQRDEERLLDLTLERVSGSRQNAAREGFSVLLKELAVE